MSRVRKRRLGAVVIGVTSLALVGASCTGGGYGYGGPPSVNAYFRGTSVTVVTQTEWAYLFGCINCYDEPYLTNIHFRVRFNDPGSATAGVVSTRSFSPEIALCETGHQGDCPGTETSTLTAGPGGSGGQVDDNGVTLLDLVDVAYGQNKLEVLGNWVWAMEEDLIGNPLPGSVASEMQYILNQTIAAGTIPDFNNGQAIVDLITQDLGTAFSAFGGALANAITGFLFIGDDLLGSRMYIRVGAYGIIGGLIDAANVNVGAINLGLTAIGMPNIQGATVRSMAAPHAYTGQVFNDSGDRHDYDFADG